MEFNIQVTIDLVFTLQMLVAAVIVILIISGLGGWYVHHVLHRTQGNSSS